LDAFLQRRAKLSEAANKKFKAFRAGDFTPVESQMPQPTKQKAAKPVFDPVIVLDVLPKLMNSQVVLLMKGDVWASHKALSGYMAFHHLLLAICQTEPAVQSELEQRVGNFLAREEARVKSRVPNLGEFICLLSASEKCDWQSVAAPLLAEVFDRNVLWLLKKYPRFAEVDDVGVSKERLRCTFEVALVSMRLVMFNVWFLNNIAKPSHVHAEAHTLACKSCSCTLHRYERTKGVPPRQQIEAVHRAVRHICEVNSWEGYFEAVGIRRVEPLGLCNWLRQSVLSSLRKRYHRPGQFQQWPRRAKERQNSDDAYYEQLADAWD
jgi:hypothetical protein